MNADPGSLARLIAILLAITLLQISLLSWYPAHATLDDGANHAGDCDLYKPSSDAVYPATVNETNNLVLKERIWISVREIDLHEASWWVAHRNDGQEATPPVIRCTVLTSEEIDKVAVIAKSIEGADACKEGTVICELPAGISAGGEQEYKLSVSKIDAESIVEELLLVENKAILELGDRYYFLQLLTTDGIVEPQARIEFLDSHFIGNTTHTLEDEIIRLEKGQSITIPFTVRTFATFGKPASINLTAGVNAQDSGLALKIEPSSSFIVPERSTERGNLTITASANAMNGVYRFSMAGKDSWIHTCGMYTDYVCPLIQIGSSVWQINTSDGGIYTGGKAPPKWLHLTAETDKDTYEPDDTVIIKSFIENDGNDTVTLSGSRLVIAIGNATSYADPNSSTNALNILYSIDAYPYNGEDDIDIQPHSKVLLVRPFYWNQKIGISQISDVPGIASDLVGAGNYTIHTSFAGYQGAVIYDSKNIQIQSVGSHSSNNDNTLQTNEPSPEQLQKCQELGIPLENCNDNAILAKIRIATRPMLSEDDIRKMEEQQNQITNSFYMIGIGAAIVGTIAFFTLRRRK